MRIAEAVIQRRHARAIVGNPNEAVWIAIERNSPTVHEMRIKMRRRRNVGDEHLCVIAIVIGVRGIHDCDKGESRPGQQRSANSIHGVLLKTVWRVDRKGVRSDACRRATGAMQSPIR